MRLRKVSTYELRHVYVDVTARNGRDSAQLAMDVAQPCSLASFARQTDYEVSILMHSALEKDVSSW